MRGLLVATALLWQGCVFASLWRTDWPEPVQVHRVVTADGWTLDLRRVPATGGPPRARPVVLMHGIVTNGRNWDVEVEHSLVRYLSARGFDVWVPSLRGVGQSEQRDEDYPFDVHVESDVPAIIAYVQAATGAKEVDWVGHSMGGMVLYAHLARGGQGIGRAVTLGSPVRFAWGGRMESLARSAGSMASAFRWPLQALTHSTMPLHGEWDGPAERLLMSRALTPAATWRTFVAVGVDDPPPALIAQFVGWVQRGQFDALSGQTDYLEGLEAVSVPTLVVAGKIDGIAPPWSVRPAFEKLGTANKRWLLLGEANGMAGDYNHMDMLLSPHAKTDLYPHIAAWLEAR